MERSLVCRHGLKNTKIVSNDYKDSQEFFLQSSWFIKDNVPDNWNCWFMINVIPIIWIISKAIWKCHISIELTIRIYFLNRLVYTCKRNKIEKKTRDLAVSKLDSDIVKSRVFSILLFPSLFTLWRREKVSFRCIHEFSYPSCDTRNNSFPLFKFED